MSWLWREEFGRAKIRFGCLQVDCDECYSSGQLYLRHLRNSHCQGKLASVEQDEGFRGEGKMDTFDLEQPWLVEIGHHSFSSLLKAAQSCAR
mmetsp:Transcript_41741/g.111872  ORF Transcript_41741/g.111872 Transcript_41741/m.111872 type:complete len:92 (-) Transcript_41741:123-398(-)